MGLLHVLVLHHHHLRNDLQSPLSASYGFLYELLPSYPRSPPRIHAHYPKPPLDHPSFLEHGRESFCCNLATSNVFVCLVVRANSSSDQILEDLLSLVAKHYSISPPYHGKNIGHVLVK